jgi:hypothetical protein
MNLKFRLEGFSVLPGSSLTAQKKISVAVISVPSKLWTQIEYLSPKHNERSRQLLQLAAMNPAMLATFGFDAIPVTSGNQDGYMRTRR